MDCTSLKQSCKIPKGLQDLMSDISREVLRNQPKNIYDFIAEYLEAMLITRENIFVGQHVVDYLIDNSLLTSEIIEKTGVELEKSNSAAIVIQRAIRKYHLKRIRETEENNFREQDVIENLMEGCGFTEREAVNVKRIIKNAFKHYYYRSMSNENKINYSSQIKWNEAAENTLQIYRKAGPLPHEMARAAISIQAAYKGYFTRKMLKRNEKLEENAVKIQSYFRGYKSRKQTEILKETLDLNATKIQAVYKGHLIRKIIKEKKDRDEVKLKNYENQAIKIQSFYRGHLVRKNNMKKSEEIIEQEEEENVITIE